MKVSLVRRFAALAALAIASLTAQAHAATLAFEALYDPSNGNISIRPFDSDTNSPWVGTAQLGLVDLQSTQSVFTGVTPNFPAASLFTTDTDVRVNFATLAANAASVSYASPWDFGNIAAPGLTSSDLQNFFSTLAGSGPASFTWSGGSGTPNRAGPVTAVPEPSTIATLAIGGFAGLGYAGRRKLRRKAA